MESREHRQEFEQRPRFLPKVTSETWEAFSQDNEEGRPNAKIQGMLEKIERENPWLAQFIQAYAEDCENPAEVETCAAFVYRLLENQAEADALKKMFSET